MTMLPTIDMTEATRLTREGRLTEALAILQGKSSGAGPQDAPPPAGLPQTNEGRSDSVLARLPSAVQGVLGRLTKVAPVLEGLTRPAPGRSRPSLPDGARFEERQYVGPAGRGTYKLYVPGGTDGRSLPLVVMLHGCTQSPDDFAAGTRMNEVAQEEGFLVAYPAQDQSANSSRCWNWFRAGDQRRDQGEPALIAGITRQIMQEFAVVPGRVYVAGLSAGGAAAAIMGQAYPDLFAAVGVHSGLACGAARDMSSAFMAMRQGGSPPRQPAGGSRTIPTIVFHGDRDGTVNAVNGDQVIAQAHPTPGLHTIVEQGEAPGGISYTRTVHTDGHERPVTEQWVLHGAGHAWSGGSAAGTYTEPRGPDASRAMMRFFAQHTTVAAQAS